MTTTKKAQAAQQKAARTSNKGKNCSVRGCGRDAMSRGLCSPHYTADRRKDPEVMAKAREASRRSHAKRVAARKAAEAAAKKAPAKKAAAK